MYNSIWPFNNHSPTFHRMQEILSCPEISIWRSPEGLQHLTHAQDPSIRDDNICRVPQSAGFEIICQIRELLSYPHWTAPCIYIYTQLFVPFRTHDPPQKKHPSCSPESQDFMKCLVPINMFLFDPSSSPHQKTRQSSSHCQRIEATLSAQGEESSQATSRHKKNIISYVYIYIYHVPWENMWKNRCWHG